MSERPRTSTEYLRRQDDEWLTRLLLLRPDAALPSPPDTSVLAGRLAIRISVTRALDDLDAWTLQVLDGLLLGPAPGSVETVVAMSSDASPADVADAIDRLRQRGLVWGDDEVNVVGAVRDAAAVRYPGGLGRPLADLLDGYTSAEVEVVLDSLGLPRLPRRQAADAIVAELRRPGRVDDLLDGAPGAARQILDRLGHDMPVGEVQDIEEIRPIDDRTSPVPWLIAHGLVLLIAADYVEVPREVGLLLRGDFPLGAGRRSPQVTATTVGRAEVDERAGAHALETLRRLQLLLDQVALESPRVLKSGGLGSREAKRLARTIDGSPELLALLLHTAQEAGLLGRTLTSSPVWLPTPAYDEWLEQPPEQQWPRLARSWSRMSSLPWLVGDGATGSPANLLSPDLDRSGAGAQRRRVLDALHTTGDGVALATTDVAALVRWRAPRRYGADGDRAVAQTLVEAQELGVSGSGALSTAGRLLLDGADDAEIAAALGKALPTPVDHVLLQADLTAVAPGRLQPDLARELADTADVESAGAATVYRITPGSLRRALDRGWSTADLHELFARRSRTPVPQTLTYLIDDAARRHGQLRVGGASAYLRCDDDAVAGAIVADHRLHHLGLRRLAPGVVISTAPPEELLADLVAAGYPPALETPDGQITSLSTQAPRARSHRPATPPPRPPALTAESATQVVAKMRAGDAANAVSRAVTTRVSPDVPGVTTAATLQVLHDAVQSGAQLQLDYVDATGSASTRLVTATSIQGGYLHAFDHGRMALRTFALHRIVSVGVLAS